ncbi:unnamed protein product, partial [Rotaria sp. Silwood1]
MLVVIPPTTPSG